MKKILLLICVALLTGTVFGSGPIRPADLVQYHRDLGHRSTPYTDLFSIQSPSVRNMSNLNGEVADGVLLNFNQQMAREIQGDAPEFISLYMPFDGNAPAKVDLVKVDLFAPGFQVTNSENADMEWDLGTHYRGIIDGVDGSIAAVSFIDGQVMGMFSAPRSGNYTLGVLAGDNATRTHILYNDADLVQSNPLDCDTEDDGGSYSEEQLFNEMENARSFVATIAIFYEVDYDIYTNQGANTAAFITAEFNEVATIYAGEDLNYILSEINIITSSANEYTAGGTATMLNEFKSRYNGFNGDLAHLVTQKTSGGRAAGFSGLCNSNPDNSMCVSDLYLTYNTVPTYSWDIMVQTHEMGHLNGSRHTHACVWNGNSTAIDGCAGFTEGSCAIPGNPSGGGTIMSYCHITSVGINFSLGFGPQPGDVIRAAASGATCLCPEDLVITANVTSGTSNQNANNTITASNTIYSGATANYSAGTRTTLTNGFTVNLGGVLNVTLEGCGGALPALVASVNDALGQDHSHEGHTGHAELADGISFTDFQVYPNPFYNKVTFEYAVQKAGVPVELTIFNATGQVLARPVADDGQEVGNYKVEFDGGNLPAGIYLYRLEIGGEMQLGRIVLER